MMLHIFNKPQAFHTFAKFVQASDSVIFIENGVYCLLGDDIKLKTENIFVLEADVLARGLVGRIDDDIKRVTYEGFVDVCSDASSISSWF